MNELLNLAKVSLGIVQTSTLKDDEIKLLIESAKLDMERQGIDVSVNDYLIKGTIVMYVKGNFGMLDVNDKQHALETYKMNCQNLALSERYREGD